MNFCNELRIDVSSLLVSSPLPLRSVKVMSIEVSGLVSSSVVSATGVASAAVGASDDAPDGDPLPRPASMPSRSKSLTENDCMWKPLTGSMVKVALPPTLNTGLPLSVMETVAPVTARYSVPLWARAISSEPWTSNTPPALMSTSSADSLKLDGPMVVVPEPPGLATWMAPVEVLMARSPSPRR